ncbi:hypothetical protein H6G91_12070 [Nostoc muscorum FACHB-395]|nr:hypothetical protein [Desmonostoc muscorum FACHB-395]
MNRFSLDFSQVRNPRGVGGLGRSLTPHTPNTPHTPLLPLPTLCVRNPGSGKLGACYAINCGFASAGGDRKSHLRATSYFPFCSKKVDNHNSRTIVK